tara:strand:+ start:2895 stop:3161 length:267 start_codon:yes stop_codon:yes gene_type:complete
MSRTFDSFAEALESVGAEDADHARQLGFTICGVMVEDGKPRYFTQELEAEDASIADKAFEIRNGRSMSEYEHWLLDMARSTRSVDAGR